MRRFSRELAASTFFFRDSEMGVARGRTDWAFGQQGADLVETHRTVASRP